jgi:adenylate cyclase
MLAALAWAVPLARNQLTARLGLVDRLESPLLDLRFLLAGEMAAPSDIALVAIDEAVVREIGTYPLPRAKLAQIVRAIGRSKPKVIGLDMLFLDPGPDEGDRELAAALAEGPAVIGAVALFEREASSPGRFDVPHASTLVRPIEGLAAAASVGITNVSTDSGGTPRHAPLLVQAGEELVPSFVLLVAAAALGGEPAFADGSVTIGTRTTRLDRGAYLPLRFFGRHATIPTISASDILHETSDPRLAGKSVIIGATVTGGGDNFATPFDPLMPGAEVLATAIAQLTGGPNLIRDRTTRWIDAGATLALPLLAILLLSWRRISMGLGLSALIAMVWLVGVMVAFANNYWLNLAAPLAALLPAAFGFAACRLVFDANEARRLQRQASELGRFQSPVFARKLAEDPDFLLAPVEREAAILFVDLTGFTGLAQSIGPLATETMLRDFHEMIMECVAEDGGAILTYMGDGAMAAFGFPDAGLRDAAGALNTARRLQHALGRRRLQAGSKTDLPGMRIGVHAGRVVFSRLGHTAHQQITASGDTVNVASRLMETAKQFGRGIVVSQALAEWAERGGADLDDFAEVVEVALRGRTGHVKARLWRQDLQAMPGAEEVLPHG